MEKQNWILLKNLFPTADDLTGTLVKEDTNEINEWALSEVDLENNICYAVNANKEERIISLDKAIVVQL